MDVGAIPHEDLIRHKIKRDGLDVDDADVRRVIERFKSKPKTTKLCGYEFAYETSKDGTGPGDFVQVLPKRSDEKTQCEAERARAEIKKTTPAKPHPRDINRR